MSFRYRFFSLILFLVFAIPFMFVVWALPVPHYDLDALSQSKELHKGILVKQDLSTNELLSGSLLERLMCSAYKGQVIEVEGQKFVLLLENDHLPVDVKVVTDLTRKIAVVAGSLEYKKRAENLRLCARVTVLITVLSMFLVILKFISDYFAYRKG